ncbi:GPR1/FUN34/yaaH family-domain-containing protein [Lentinula detonsa]|uniref:GPR1/FUN34/yaaH family-domain-containing protein n=1 Tax=Lentinula detonsa TaxID=2804962 RepID=A0A9W8TUY6_9AGAR|nr:GPR1/FUN34/yaaH family-domain-containing protein [Lentinula detonsa]
MGSHAINATLNAHAMQPGDNCDANPSRSSDVFSLSFKLQLLWQRLKGSTGDGKIANPGPAGAISFAATALLLSLLNVQAGSVEHLEVIVSMAVFTGGLSQFMAGMWEYPRGNVFNATPFSLYGSFWMSYATIFIPAPGILAAYKDSVRRRPPQPCSHSYAFYHPHNSRHSQHLAIQSRRNAHSPFAVLHSETSEQVAVDMDYHWTMYELHHKVNPMEVIVGCWIKPQHILCTDTKLLLARDCSSSSHPSAPHPAIHVFLDTGVEPGQPAGVKGYVSSPVGVFPKPENCVFVPVPVELRFRDSERSGVDLLTSTALSSSSTASQPLSDLTILESSIQNVISMIDRVLTYVRAVLTGEAKGDAAIGMYLMDTLGASTADLEKGGFNGRLQDTLMISLANLVRAQAEVSSRLTLVTAS